MITIIDYGMGNLRSAQKAFEFLGYETIVTDDIEKIKSAQKLVLPGVGAFADAMERLNSKGITQVIKDKVADGVPFMGICLGMQLIFEKSYEGGEFQGIGLIEGEIVKFDIGNEYKVPHMGWNIIKELKGELFEGIDDGAYTYFVHSFYAMPKDKEVISAKSNYDIDFTAAIQKGNVFASQYHPEKSGDIGLKMLDNFAKYKG